MTASCVVGSTWRTSTARAETLISCPAHDYDCLVVYDCLRALAAAFAAVAAAVRDIVEELRCRGGPGRRDRIGLERCYGSRRTYQVSKPDSAISPAAPMIVSHRS